MAVLGEAGRWVFWVGLRPAARLGTASALQALGRAGGALRGATSPGRRRLAIDEIARSFPEIREAERPAVAREASALAGRCLAEELLLDRLDTASVERFMRFDGRDHLDAALADGRGVVLVHPHAGAVMLMIALLALSGHDYGQVALRGFPPADRPIPAEMRPTALNRRVRAARDAAENALPARFFPVEGSARELYRALDRNGIVGIAFDGRGGTRFRPTPWLGRTALLSTGPWRLAARTGASVVPAMCLRSDDRSHVLHLESPLRPDASLPFPERAAALQHAALSAIEPLVRRHPAHYVPWLVHCRLHAALDDHPLFVDQALDDRWRIHEETTF